jgi:ABC-2 type transport system ATP-binding protein
MIDVTNLTKHYGSHAAVDDLSFSVRPGVVTGFLGPNGAGKSTTMRMILGLDPQTRASIWEYISQLREQEDITIFLTTHYMDEAENCDRIAIMDEGRLVALDTPAALKASVGTDRVTIRTEDDEAALQALPDAVLTADGIVISVEDGESYVPRLFGSLGVPITSVSISRPSLDDVFLSYTGRTIRDSESTPTMPAFFAAMRR